MAVLMDEVRNGLRAACRDADYRRIEFYGPANAMSGLEVDSYRMERTLAVRLEIDGATLHLANSFRFPYDEYLGLHDTSVVAMTVSKIVAMVHDYLEVSQRVSNQSKPRNR
jgi:hypothetical protein